MSPPAQETVRAEALLAAGRTADAIASLERALASDPQDVRAWCLLGTARLQQKQPRNAAHAASKAIALDPDREWPHRILSVAYVAGGYGPRAIAPAREAVRLAPNLAITHAQLGVALSSLAFWRWRSAARESAIALRLAPLDANIHSMVGDAALRRRHRRTAERHYLKALEIDPNSPRVISTLAIARMQRGRMLAAAEGFSTAAGLNPREDMHRLLLDVTAVFLLTLIAPLLLLVGLVSLIDHRAGVLVFAVPPVAAAFLWTRRDDLPAGAWRYLRRVLWRNPFVTFWACLVVADFCLLAAAVFTSSILARELTTGAIVLAAAITVTTTWMRVVR